jgi:hypothetical protein
MSRRTSLLAGLLLGLTPLLLGQELQNQAVPRFPGDVLTSQLVAWTQMQKPKPVPEPLPPPDKGVPEPDRQTTPPARPQALQQTPAETFTGKIVKDGGKYVLKVSSNTTYQLEEQSSLEKYKDQDVRIVGTLDASGNTIRIVKIELVS